MGRMPYHIQVFPYRQMEDGYRFALFERSDIADVWQGVCGGGESGESVVQTALRECGEEAGITQPGPLYPLDNISCMRSTFFTEWCGVWGDDIVVLPMYFFGMPYDGPITISDEHNQYRWCRYDEADALMRMPDQNTALWELNQRLLRGNVQRAIPACMQQAWRPGAVQPLI